MKINHIEKVTKFVSVEGEESRLAIFIEYNEKKDVWERFKFYYNKNEISEVFHNKELKTLEEVRDEILTIYEKYGALSYFRFYDEENNLIELKDVKFN